ncbi:MAG: ABC transporter permease [Alphaproteobacteria bacterium]|nr:ABC transporter permease [Alphaproteobacteria bacterium]MBE6467400.1 ABC transporter permease [Alphaproteobacteria bacterium]
MGLEFEKNDNHFLISPVGDILLYDDQKRINALFNSLKNVEKVSFNTEELQKWDSSLVAILFKLALVCQKNDIKIDWSGLPKNLQQLVELALKVDRKPTVSKDKKIPFFERVGGRTIENIATIKKVMAFLKDVFASLRRFISGTAVMRKIDFDFALEDCGYKAVGIVSLVSFMVGLILAFVGAIQLKMFGAEIYIASLVTIGMIRIMGAIMAGIIMAGRTGASYAATIGTMQVNEEVDALKTLGFDVSDFLILPRLLSLVLVMPFLTMLADIMGIIGGGVVAIFILDIAPQQYVHFSVEAFGLNNFLVGLFHGLVYGVIISACGCYYGIACGRNADSVGLATTKAVVSSIVIMIVATGIITWICQAMGI